MMPILPAHLGSWATIKDYLENNQDAIESANNAEVVPYIMPIFKASITNDPVVMMQFHRWLDQHVSTELRYIVTENIPDLMDVDMSPYKFKIVLGMRGPMDEAHMIDFVKANIGSETVKEITKHLDFPQDARELMYVEYNDICYVSADAQEMFVF